MARTKGSKNGIRQLKKTSNRMTSPYLFRNGDEIIYNGNLWEAYIGQKGIIERCYLEKKIHKWYKIRFDDGRIILVKEDWIADQKQT